MLRKMAVVAILAVLAAGCAGGMQIGRPSIGAVPDDAAVLAIQSNVAGAEVYLNGNLVGTIERADKRQDFVIPAGQHELMVARFGYEDYTRRIATVPGARNTLQVDLQRLPARPVSVQ